MPFVMDEIVGGGGFSIDAYIPTAVAAVVQLTVRVLHSPDPCKLAVSHRLVSAVMESEPDHRLGWSRRVIVKGRGSLEGGRIGFDLGGPDACRPSEQINEKTRQHDLDISTGFSTSTT